MKIRKIWVGICGLTFIIGCVSVFAYLSISRNQSKPSVQIAPVALDKTSAPDFKVEKVQETIEENEFWGDEELPDFKIKLLETGDGFHGDQVKARSGETWLGFFDSDDGRHFLRPTKIKIRRVYDEIIDGENKRLKTGKTVSVAGNDKPLFLLKNAAKLKSGKIKTLFRGYLSDEAIGTSDFVQSLDNGFVRDYEIGGRNYRLKVSKGLNKKGEAILALILEGEGLKQTLHSMKSEYADNNIGTLYWVGDLDGDGKPDFYTNLFVRENVDYRNLYLSSETETGKLVKEVAAFSTTGC